MNAGLKSFGITGAIAIPGIIAVLLLSGCTSTNRNIERASVGDGALQIRPGIWEAQNWTPGCYQIIHRPRGNDTVFTGKTWRVPITSSSQPVFVSWKNCGDAKWLRY